MTIELFQFFENSNKAILQAEMNEFCASVIDSEHFDIIEVRLQEPNWDRAMIRYRAKMTQDELQKLALEKLEQERIKTAARQYTDEELKQIAEQNAKVEQQQQQPQQQQVKEKPAPLFDGTEVEADRFTVKEDRGHDY